MWCRIAVVTYQVRLLKAALCADEYLGIQIKGRVDWLNQFEPQLATAAVAV